MTIASVIYAVCALTSLLCAGLLLRGYRNNGYKLLFWSGLCFIGLFLNNILMILHRMVLPAEADLATWRLIASLAAMLLLLYGLIWDEE
ncbi:MAG: DUF5985 family protein [Noviherbaspirillum sp.]